MKIPLKQYLSALGIVILMTLTLGHFLPELPEMDPATVEHNQRITTDPAYALQTGRAMLNLGDFEGAQRTLQRAGDSPEADEARGDAEMLLQNYPSATNFYLAAWSLDTGNRKLTGKVIGAMKAAGRHEQAEQFRKGVLVREPLVPSFTPPN